MLITGKVKARVIVHTATGYIFEGYIEDVVGGDVVLSDAVQIAVRADGTELRSEELPGLTRVTDVTCVRRASSHDRLAPSDGEKGHNIWGS